ncbi:unnamed protein product [Knipowitschia caucasica]
MATFTAPNRHLTLSEIEKEHQGNWYLDKISKHNLYPIRAYPRPELHVYHLSHSTDLAGLQGIQEDGGFRDPGYDQDPGLVWFSLTPTPEDLSAAASRPMTLVHPGGKEEAWWSGVCPGLLQSFATSPAFSSTSRYGSYRLTFDLSEVLDRYSEQFCDGEAPVLRTWSTELYKQEVMYTVLVSSPYDDYDFYNSPELRENTICSFREYPETHFLWRPQAMSETHEERVVHRGNAVMTKPTFPNYYVWDHVTVALVLRDEVLRFPQQELRSSLRFCEKDQRPVDNHRTFESYKVAKKQVNYLWPGSGQVQKFKNSEYHIYNGNIYSE